MPIRIAVVSVLLILTALLVAFIGSAFESEFYLPVLQSLGRRGRFFGPRGFAQPPTSPWFLALLLVFMVGLTFASFRYAAIVCTLITIAMFAGIPIGMQFQWTPGIAHYLVCLCLGSLTVFAWTNDYLSSD